MRRLFPVAGLLILAGLLPGLLAACDSSGNDSQQSVAAMMRTAVTPTPGPPTDTPGPTSTPTVTLTPEPPPTLALDMSEVKSQLARIEADTAKMRGLKPKAHVPEHFYSQAELKYHLGQDTLKEYTVEAAHRDVIRLWLLMFIDDPTMDFRQLEVEFAGDNILGYYDPKVKELYVRADQPTLSPPSRETLAHEFTHSLQDQYHNLSQFLPDNMDSDQATAHRALVEGDATVSGILYASRYMSMGDFRKIFSSDAVRPAVPGRAPVYLREAWQFPYAYGSEFILSLAPPGSFKAVDAAFNDPPRSTEQIMHPEKYLNKPRDNPLPVTLPPLTDTLGAGWAFRETDTLGEFDLQIMLRENFIEQPEASEGWGGACYALYENGPDALVIMGSRWDTKRDASEFEDALEQSFKLFQKYDTLWHDSKRVWGLKRSGEQIMFVNGTNLAAVQRVIASIK
ncbi:MAG: hypothetical protein ACJ78Q_15670 [Chloroflexia bacterium]